jgi:hypothetical protein
MRHCSESFRRSTRSAIPADRVNWWMQSSKVLRIKGAQGRGDSRADPNNPFFHAWTKHRDPKSPRKNN